MPRRDGAPSIKSSETFVQFCKDEAKWFDECHDRVVGAIIYPNVDSKEALRILGELCERQARMAKALCSLFQKEETFVKLSAVERRRRKSDSW